MAKYYFLTTLLPTLKIGQTPELTWRELDFYLRLNLTHDDGCDVATLRRLTDLENLRLLWQHLPLNPNGNLDEKELEERQLQRDGLPCYVLNYLEMYHNTASRLEHFPELLRDFFRYELERAHGFMQSYLTFERTWRLTAVALRAHQLHRDVATALQGESADDPLVLLLLEGGIPEGYEQLKIMLEINTGAPFAIYQALCEWRFAAVETMSGWHTFHIDRILAYVIQLEICEQWLQLDAKKGMQRAQQLVEAV